MPTYYNKGNRSRFTHYLHLNNNKENESWSQWRATGLIIAKKASSHT